MKKRLIASFKIYIILRKKSIFKGDAHDINFDNYIYNNLFLLLVRRARIKKVALKDVFFSKNNESSIKPLNIKKKEACTFIIA